MKPVSKYFLILLASLSATTAWPQSSPESGEWPLCRNTLDIPPRPVIEQALEPDDIYVTADKANMVEGGTSHFEGNAEVAKNKQQTRADIIDYHQPENSADLKGNVHYWDETVYLHSSTAHIEMDHDTGEFQNADYRLLATRGRGKAKELYIVTGKTTEGKTIDYTTCDPEDEGWDFTNNVWKVSAKELILNHEEGRGSAKHAILRIKDIPVFYTPYMTFPLNDKRKSGFLIPTFGSSNRNGFELRTPYYWNIAPEMDATFTPRLITDSGLMLMNEYRYLNEHGGGIFNVDYLPSDPLYDDRDRSSVAINLSQSVARIGTFGASYNRVSDTEYFEDFGNGLTDTSTQFLLQQATLSNTWNIHGHNLRLYSLVEAHQIVDRSLPITSRPYKRLPTIQLNLSSPYNNQAINYNVKSQLDYFTRGNDPLLNNVEGVRFDLFPTITYPIRSTSGYFSPKAGLRYTQYNLNNNIVFQDKSPNRVLPIFSLDSGLYFEKKDSLFGHGYYQTLEPRVFYLYIPETDQTDLPVFDTALYDLSSSHSTLFYEDRFSGADRMGDANQFTLSVTSQFQLDNSSTRGSLTVGQAFFLRDREVVLPRQAIQKQPYSPLIVEFNLTPINHLTMGGSYHWDFENQISRRFSLNAQYQPGEKKVINISYDRLSAPSGVIRRAVTSLEQTNVSFQWPLGKQWSIIGRWYYDLPTNRSLEVFGGVEYESCCWAFRAVGRRFLSNLDGDFQTAFFLQIELKGLAGIGRKTVDFLTENISGYESDF